jgi:ABC-2 type transport system permease protein
MNTLLNIYVQQFKVTLASFLQYRAEMFIWMIGHVLEPLIYLVVWSVVSASNGGSVAGYNARDFAAYFIVMMLVNHCTYTWVMWEFEYRIRHGSLSFALLRPVHPIHTDVVDNVSSKLITLPVMLIAALTLALIFKPVFHCPTWAAIMFIPALLIAFSVRFLIEWTLALASFWTTRVSAINSGYYVVSLFLAGQMAPLALLPLPVQTIAAILPFRWTISFPVELLLGKLTPGQALAGMATQVVWLGLSFVLVKIVWRGGVRIYSAVGA